MQLLTVAELQSSARAPMPDGGEGGERGREFHPHGGGGISSTQLLMVPVVGTLAPTSAMTPAAPVDQPNSNEPA